MSPDAGPLSGLLIADLSTGIAGGYCTKILADGGAEVVKLEPPEGDSLRSWSASRTSIREGDDGALFQFLSSSKRSVVADPSRSTDLDSANEIIESADAVVWSAGSRLAELDALRPANLLRSHPHLVVTSITPFGLEGPWRDQPATEFTLQAWSGGAIGLGRGDPSRAPVFVGGQVGEWLTGAFAAAGTLIANRRQGARQVGELVDVSMLETIATCLTYYPVTYFESTGRPFRKRRSIVTPGVAMAKDGMVAVGVGTGQQWLDFCVMVEHPEWMEDKSLFRERSHLAPMIDKWFADHTVDEIQELATTFRLPNALIGNGSNLPGLDHFEARRSFEDNVRGGFLQPKPPFRMKPVRLRSPDPAPRLGEHNSYSSHPSRQSRKSARPADPDGLAALQFSGLRILDMTAFWAGPSCTHILAMLGAEVIHLESPTHLDGTRMLGPALTEKQWWERSPIFSALNTNKKSLALDFRDERGIQLLKRLIATCDVIVENYTPRVLDQAGFTFESLRAIRDDIVLVRMPGFGLDGPWRDNAAFAYTIEDASGFTWMTGHPDEKPLEPYCVGDPNAGVHALIGLLLALEHRRRTGEGVAVEAAMVDAAVNVTAEQVIEYSAYGSLLERAGNRGPTAAPQNLYATADTDASGGQDDWVAIAVATDLQWEALTRVLGSPKWALALSLSSSPGRTEHHDLIDEHLAAWCVERKADEIVEALWPAGIPVAKVLQPHCQTEVTQLEARRFFEVVDHPVAGAARHSTLPMRFSAGPHLFHHRHAPLLGEHNSEVLRELGLTDEDIASLESAAVIGRAPHAS